MTALPGPRPGQPLTYAGPAPREFPPAPARLHGRDAELSALTRILASPDHPERNTAVITGPPGSGRTALALHWFRRRAPRLHDQVRADCDGGTGETIAETLERWLRALGVPARRIPAAHDARAALWRDTTAGRDLAILVTGLPPSPAYITALRPGPGPATLIATAVTVPPGLPPYAGTVHAAPLGDTAGLAVLTDAAGRSQAAAAGPAAADLARACAGSPLALRAAGGILASARRPAAAAAANAARKTAAAPGPPARATARLSAAELSPSCSRAARLLSCLPCDSFCTGLAAAVLLRDPGQAAVILTRLRTAGLADRDGPDRYRIHPETAAALAPARQDSRTVTERAARWYLRHAAAARRLLPPPATAPAAPPGPPDADTGADAGFTSPGEALDWLAHEQQAIRAVIAGAAARGLPALAWQLADAARPLWHYRGTPRQQLAACKTALTAARDAADPEGQARILDQVSQAAAELGQHQAAARAASEARSLAPRLAGLTLPSHVQGLAAASAARDEEAARLLAAAVTAYTEAGVRHQAATAGTSFALALARTGRDSDAARRARDAIALLEDGTDPCALAHARAALGYALARDHPAAATPLLEDALRVMTDHAALPEQELILAWLAQTALYAGDLEQAGTYGQQARELLSGP